VGDPVSVGLKKTGATTMLALFEVYPLLKENFPYVSLGEFPTPVEKLERLGQVINIPRLHVKREDLSGKLYGGNKIRALEFLLGEAIHKGYQEVFAFGFPASCAALAQAIYAPEIGLKNISFLAPQVKSQQGRKHLLIYQSIGANIRPALPMLLPYLIQYRIRHGRFPKFIEASTPVGMIGYVSAGLELKKQIEEQLLPEPDLIYMNLATMGTAVGLMLGLKAARLTSKVVAVTRGGKILGRKIATFDKALKLFHETNKLLRSADPSFPDVEISDKDFMIRSGYEHGNKTLLNAAGAQAMQRVKELENLQLDEMFTANSCAALIADGEAGHLRDKTVLWWNSYSSRDFSSVIASADYRQLPKYFHRYFENVSS
jgi:1-aminocyclopropane-1-carboxylate deaminase/D-cysteine desulfhydrase-like pyridoxal-dependent ACC family enzyme